VGWVGGGLGSRFICNKISATIGQVINVVEKDAVQPLLLPEQVQVVLRSPAQGDLLVRRHPLPHRRAREEGTGGRHSRQRQGGADPDNEQHGGRSGSLLRAVAAELSVQAVQPDGGHLRAAARLPRVPLHRGQGQLPQRTRPLRSQNPPVLPRPRHLLRSSRTL